MGVSSEVVGDVIVFTTGEFKLKASVVALYYIDRGKLIAFSLPNGCYIDFTEVLKVLKAGGYPVNERRHVWKVVCWRGQNFTLDFPEDYHYGFWNCRVPLLSAVLDVIEEYNTPFDPSDYRYVSQLVTL